jgi:hypothetical protein
MQRLAAAAMGAGLVLCGGAQAQSTAELKGALDQAMKTIQDLQARVKALEDQKAQAPAPAAAAASAAAAGPVVVAPGTSADEGAKDAGQARAEIYGQVMADAIYDFKKMDPDWTATLRPSKIPICPGSAGCGKDGRFDFGIRQSSLGVRGFIPTAYGVLKTDLAFDLFGSDGSTSIHWLRAWAELGKFGVGQTDSNFMDLSVFPNTIDYWGPPGMVFVRNPQVRFTPLSADGMTVALSLEAPSSAIDTGKVTAVDPELGAGVTSRNRLPDFVASFRYDRDWGHVRAAGILRQVGFQNSASPDGEPSNDKTGYGLNLSGTFKLFGKDQLNWQVVGGHAIASYMDDGGIDLAPDATLHAQTVRSLGYFVYYNHAWTEKWTTALGYSEHRQSNAAGQLGSAFHTGSYGSINALYQLSKNVMTGAEYIWGRHETFDGSSAIDTRVQWSTRVSF